MFRVLHECARNARVVYSAVFAVLLALAVLGCTTAEPAVEASANEATPTLVVPLDASSTPGTITLGVAAGRRTGQTPIDALIHVEQVAGRQLDTLRAYAFWDGEFPDLRHRFASDGQRMLHLSVNARRTDGSVVPWSEIATADPGDPVYDELVSWIDRLADYDADLRVTFHHEADIEPEFGSPADFVAAWQRFTSMLAEAAPDIETVWVMTAFSLDRPIAEEFWPGADHVDIIGADAFNWFGCRGTPEAWRSPEEVLAPLMSFAARHPNKPLVLAELGSDEDPDDPGRKADWFDELASLVATIDYDRIDTIVFFHNDHDADSTCDWWLDSSERSTEAFQQLAALPLFGGDTAVPPPTQCPAIATVTSSVDDVAIVDGDGDGRFDFEFGLENRFLGVGDQSADGADHRLLLMFPALEPLPPEATLELRIRVGERQPALPAPIELLLLDEFETMSQAFSQPGQVLAPILFDASTPGGQHVVDMTGQIDPTNPTTFRLQLTAVPPTGDGQAALFLGTGDASRSIDRPALIARLCE